MSAGDCLSQSAKDTTASAEAGQVMPGGVCGLLLTNLYVIAVVMMIIGPVVGALGGAVGGFVAAGHPLRPWPARSWAAGVFVRF